MNLEFEKYFTRIMRESALCAIPDLTLHESILQRVLEAAQVDSVDYEEIILRLEEMSSCEDCRNHPLLQWRSVS